VLSGESVSACAIKGRPGEELMADLGEVVFAQAGHFHDGVAVKSVLQHGAGNFEFAYFNPRCSPS
jgi:hypothetical protein